MDTATVSQFPGKSFPMSRWLWMLCPPVILIMGTFGNAATVGILSRMGTGRRGGGGGGGGRGGGGWSTMNMYLLALAISDMCVLYGGLMRYWLIEVFSVDVFSGHSLLCKLGMWIFGTGYNNGTYLLVALTLQRTISVLWPHRVHLVCTPTTTKAAIAAVTLTSSLLLGHVLYGYDLVVVVGVTNGTSFMCGHGSPDYHHFAAKVWVYVEILTFAVLPFLCLVVSNTLLAWKLAHSVREAKHSLTGSSSSRKAEDTRTKKMYSTTVTVMAMSFLFLVFNLPLFVSLIISSSYNVDAPEELLAEGAGAREPNDTDYFLQGLVTILMQCNSAVNFYLYCLTGTRFRNELKKWCLCRDADSRVGSTSSSVVSRRGQDTQEEF